MDINLASEKLLRFLKVVMGLSFTLKKKYKAK